MNHLEMSFQPKFRISEDAGFEEGRILVTKDRSVLEMDEDGEEVVDMVDIDRHQFKRPDELVDSFLGKFDKIVQNEKLEEKTEFNLGEEISILGRRPVEDSVTEEKLIVDELKFSSDFYEISEIEKNKKFSKFLKTNGKKLKRREPTEEDETIHVSSSQRVIDEADDELYSKLEIFRKIQKKSKKFEPSSSTIPEPPPLPKIEMEILKDSDDDIHQTGILLPSEIIPSEPQPSSLSTGPSAREILTDIRVDSGLACALKYFQARRESKEQEDDEIQIEHRDKFGNLLNPKEAFKELSWKFHGIRPNEKKIRKIRKQ
jgi:hypothetical protein